MALNTRDVLELLEAVGQAKTELNGMNEAAKRPRQIRRVYQEPVGDVSKPLPMYEHIIERGPDGLIDRVISRPMENA